MRTAAGKAQRAVGRGKAVNREEKTSLLSVPQICGTGFFI